MMKLCKLKSVFYTILIKEAIKGFVIDFYFVDNQITLTTFLNYFKNDLKRFDF